MYLPLSVPTAPVGYAYTNQVNLEDEVQPIDKNEKAP